MAERKPLFLSASGYHQEADTADDMHIGGLTMGGNIDMQTSNGVVSCNAATATGDALVYGQGGANLQDLTLTTDPSSALQAARKSYVDSAALSGAHVKEAVLESNMLDNTQGIEASVALVLQSQPDSGDSITITDGTTTRIYSFGSGGDVTVTIGSDANDSATNLKVAIDTDGSGAWSAIARLGTLESIDADSRLVIIYENSTAGSESKIYGSASWDAGQCQIVDFGGETDYTKNTLTDIPESLPGSTNFGFRRTKANLSNGEIHNNLSDDTLHMWDADANSGAGEWTTFSGAGAITTATGASGGGTKGKATFDTDYGFEVTSGVVGLNLATNGGLEFSGGDLRVKIASADEISYHTGGIRVEGLPATFIIGSTAVGATVTAANVDDICDGSNADSLHVHTTTGISFNHSSLGSIGTDDHHNKSHVITSADHTASGLTTGHVLTVTGANSYAFQTPAEATAMQREENTVTTATDATTNGDPVYTNANDTVGKADAATDAKARVMGVIRTGAGAAGSDVEVVSHGPCADILSSATVNTPYYLASGGGITTTKPATSGDRVIMVGYAMNADDLFVHIYDYGKVA